MRTLVPEVVHRARAFALADVDAETRQEIEALADLAERGDLGPLRELEDRFSGPLRFGTAGLRGVIGAGESRMNRAVVIRATSGLARYLKENIPEAPHRGVVLGRDGRRMSEVFQRDAAEVLAREGLTVHFLEGTSPTPLVAFGVRRLGAAAGIMITASHNPPAYNGYKVYWENGAQIIPPHDEGIARRIDGAPPARDVTRASFEEARASGLISIVGLDHAYLEALRELEFDRTAPVSELSIAYSALHGVGEPLFRRALSMRGFTRILSVAEQAAPDPRFPTVEFPNPEEPGALDRVLALAEASSSDLVLVNDPDADRLGVAVRARDGRYQVLGGNETGVLIADHVLSAAADPTDRASGRRLVMATIVSSRMLSRMAADLGAAYAETLTGFKWIANEALRLEREEGLRFAFGYEEALGYTVGTVVRDKDGIGAALVIAEAAAVSKARGQTLLDRLEAIRRRHGLFVSRLRSITLPGREGKDRIERAMARLRADPPWVFDGARVSSVWDLASGTRTLSDGTVRRDARWSGDVLILDLEDGGRVSARPSGTEPKIKLYLEVVERAADGEPMEGALARGARRLDAVERALCTRAGLLPA